MNEVQRALGDPQGYGNSPLAVEMKSEPIPSTAADSICIIRKISRRSSNLSASSILDEPSVDELEIDPSHIDRGQIIATGFSSEVFKGIWKGTDVALKELHWNDRLPEKKLESFRKELNLMFKFRHPNLVMLMGAVTKSLPRSLVLEYCCGGTLFDIVHRRRKVELSWRQRMKILLDVAKAMNYLHTSNPIVIHRDLKSLNVLLFEHVEDEYDTPIAKVSDFGLSTFVFSATHDSDTKCQSLVGTYHWMAPEITQGKQYNEKVDSYAYAIVAYEVASRTMPYEGSPYEKYELALAVARGLRPNMSRLDKACPSAVSIIIETCWSEDPSKRMSFDRIIAKLKSATLNS